MLSILRRFDEFFSLYSFFKSQAYVILTNFMTTEKKNWNDFEKLEVNLMLFHTEIRNVF